jgi:hypothetical protein
MAKDAILILGKLSFSTLHHFSQKVMKWQLFRKKRIFFFFSFFSMLSLICDWILVSHPNQCCGAGAARSRIFWSEPEPDPEP